MNSWRGSAIPGKRSNWEPGKGLARATTVALDKWVIRRDLKGAPHCIPSLIEHNRIIYGHLGHGCQYSLNRVYPYGAAPGGDWQGRKRRRVNVGYRATADFETKPLFRRAHRVTDGAQRR
jgi:hypothetical protein